MRPLAVAVALLLGGPGSAAAAASVPAELEGQVVDPEGRPLPGLDLVVTDAGGRSRQSTISDPDGRFHLLLPGPGTWRLALHGVGPDGARSGAVVLAVPGRARLQLRLVLAGDRPLAVRVHEGRADGLARVWARDPALAAPARGVSLGQALTAVPGAAAPAPPADGPVLAGTDPAEADLRLEGFSLRDPVDGRIPWELPASLFAEATPHLGLGDTVAGEGGRAAVDLAAGRATRTGGTARAIAEVVGPAGEAVVAGRPTGWVPGGFLLAAGEMRSSGGRLRGRVAVAPSAPGWQADPASPRLARGRRTRLLPALARLDAEAGGFQLQLTALGLATRQRLGRPGRLLAADEIGAEDRDLGLVGMAARRPLTPALALAWRAGWLGSRASWWPLGGDPLRTSAGRATLAAELQVLGEAGGRHRLRFGVGLEDERARRRGPSGVRPGEPPVERARAEGRALEAALDERYRPFDWLELEGGVRAVLSRLSGRSELGGAAGPLDRSVSPGLGLAPRASLALYPPLAGSRFQITAGRFAGPLPLWPLLTGADAPPAAVALPTEDAALAVAELDRSAWRVAVLGSERRTEGVLEDRLSPATGRLELFRPARAARRYRTLLAVAELRAGELRSGVGVSWSSLRGNHEGATDPFTGRLRPAATSTWDSLDPGVAAGAEGPLPFDRRLSLRLHGERGWRLSASWLPGARLTTAAALRLDGGTPRSARGWSAEGAAGGRLLDLRGSAGRTRAAASLDAGLALSFVSGGRLTTVALQGANLTGYRPVVAREELLPEGPGAGAPARPSHGNPVAWAEPLSLKLLLGFEM